MNADTSNGTTPTPDSLEFVMLEMHMTATDIWREGFADSLAKAAEELGGTLLFNVRLDDEDAYQRCAAVLLNQGQEDECVALVFLDKSGRSVHLENAEESSHPLAASAFNGRHSPTAPA
jgi:hypothetical protein